MSVSWSKDRGPPISPTGLSNDEFKSGGKYIKSRQRTTSKLTSTGSKDSTDSGGSLYESSSRVRLRHMMSTSESNVTKLPNSLVEMCVVVGMDDDTGLKYSRQSQLVLNDGRGDIFGQPMEPSVLAVISSQLAYFPQSRVTVDPFYPPIAAVTTPIPSSPGLPPHSMRGVFASHQPRKSFSRRMSTKARALPFPHNQEMINSLPPLCFPSDAYVCETRPRESFHSLVLTSISGRRSYATCLIIHRPYSVKQMPGGGLSLIECPSSSVHSPHNERGNDKMLLCWVPTCICLISQQPYFTVFKESLTTLIPQLRDKPNNLNHVLKEFTLQLTMVPIPPAGPVSINFLLNELLTVHPPDHPDKPVVDIPLHLPFLLFTLDQILQIITCILTQQRLVFLSQDFAIITPVIECFLTYILPFKWPFVYVPVVWNAMLDLLEAPGCYIMGCSAIHRSRISQIEGLVMVDLERGQVQMCDTVRVPSIPSLAAEEFKTRFQTIRPGFYDICMLNRPVAASFETEKQKREQIQRIFQWDIQDCFLEMLVTLFRDTSDYISTELRIFKRDEFLASRTDEHRDFYKEVRILSKQIR